MVEIEPRAEVPLRGRSREVDVLDAAVRALAHGRGDVVVIEGRTGSGKTSLMAKALLSARRDGLRCLQATAVAAERGSSLKPLFHALGDGARPVLDPVALREVARMPDGHHAAIAELERRLSKAAARTPLVIAIDDVHNADDATLLALRKLPSDRAILCVLAAAPGRADSTTRALALAGANVLSLAPLGPEAVRELASDVLGGVPNDAVVGLVDDLDGHPGFIVELLNALIDEGFVEVANGSARLTGHGLRRALCGRGEGSRAIPNAGLGLTRSELAVAKLVARGASNREAADELFLSPHTINSHLRHTFEKLGIRSRVQLAVLLTGAPAGS
jgi:DNA-binding CsgD family transcriptional regulator